MSEAMQLAQVQGAPSLPQVNLLPPHLRAKRKLAAARRWLALVLLLVLLGTVLAAVSTRWESKRAEAALVEVQDENQSLVSQQTKYADVPLVLGEVKARKDARSYVMATEMLWSPYLGAISAATPLNASIDSLSVSQDTVVNPSQTQVNGPLSTTGTVGQVSLNGRAQTVAAVSDWQDALSAIRGITDVEVSSIAVADDNGTAYYAVGMSFSLTPDAFANQFATEE